MSLFGKDSQKRITDTLDFIKNIQGIDDTSKNTFIFENKNNIQISPKISLGFILVKDKAETQRRRALRALLLCIGTLQETVINDAKQYFKNKSLDVLTEGIKSYFPLTGKDEKSVVGIITARTFTLGLGDNRGKEFYKYTRKALLNKEVVGGGNCYGAACLFLYLGGVVSLRWLLKYGLQQGTKEPVNLFTFGPRITEPDVAKDISEGKLLYYYRPVDAVHYTISIGNGNCVGHNNSDEGIVNFPKTGYGPQPDKTCSTFQIAGYLKGCQDALIKQNKNRTEAYILAASCVPKVRF
jgi:hypothetical protein